MLLGVDVGGTFTDAVLVEAGGAVHIAKVPSTPADQATGVLEAVASVLGRAGAQAQDVRRFCHGMTVATNALLEGRAARTALVATAGFEDVLELGRQNRPHLYRLCEGPPAPLVPAELRFGAPERMGPDGPLQPLGAEAARSVAGAVARAQPEAVAVTLLHSYRDAAHERLLGELLDELLPYAQVSLSCDLVGTFREYERTATTVIDAALSPLLGSYLRRLGGETRAQGLPEPLIMQSSGGLAEAERAAGHAALTVLSGPAGGVGGARLLAGLAGEPDVLCFDMGGTSCDACLIERAQVAETAERTVAGRPLSLPALDIHTVGAGGGSIAWRDAGGALRVGPASAGAVPGPACYGRGGTEPTVTDANLLLGRLLAGAPLAGDISLDGPAAERAVGTLARELGLEVLACARGIVQVAETEMLKALRLLTVERGLDPRDFVLMPFGGAGPLHAASMAGALGIDRVLCPQASGVLSALGLAGAAPRRDVARSVMLGAGELSHGRLEAAREALLAAAREALGEPVARVRLRHELRYRGQSYELAIDAAPDSEPSELAEAFARAHERRYGYRDDAAEVELINIRASVWGRAPELRLSGSAVEPPQTGSATVDFAGGPAQATVLRGELAGGTRVAGPALCAMAHATLLVPPGWRGEVDEHGTCRLERER
jgi:N-methylhydantoinase A